MLWLLLLAMLAVPASAEELRLIEAEDAAPYRGVGRLNVAGNRFCTATLISPTVVVTAAHCLFQPRSGARVPMSEFRFVAGLRRGEVAALGRPVRAVTHPDFRFGAPDLADVGADIAVLELGTPIPQADAAPLAVGAPDGEAVSIVSYQRGRAQVATLKGPCPPIATVGAVLAVDCAVTWGVSGAPVLAGEGAESRLVAVVSAMGRAFGDRDVALTVLVAPALDGLLAALAEAPLELPAEP